MSQSFIKTVCQLLVLVVAGVIMSAPAIAATRVWDNDSTDNPVRPVSCSDADVAMGWVVAEDGWVMNR